VFLYYDALLTLARASGIIGGNIYPLSTPAEEMLH
jgi:hypothetical protein